MYLFMILFGIYLKYFLTFLSPVQFYLQRCQTDRYGGVEVILNISEKLKDLANFEKRDWKIVLENNEPGIKGCCFSQHPFGCLALA